MKEHVWIKRVLYITIVVLGIGSVMFLNLYRKVYAANIFTPGREDYIFYIPSGATYSEVLTALDSLLVIRNLEGLTWAAEKKNYPKHVYAGRYRIKNRTSNNDLINKLRAGIQEPVKITFNNIRTIHEFANRISEQLEMESADLLDLLNDPGILRKYEFNKENIKCMFIPNTYEFYWNVKPERFLERMYDEYETFWEGRRDRKAAHIGMSRTEIITLASIVNEESSKEKEKSRIAGLYINRLKKPMRLQADPTVIYAVGDFSIQRVLRRHYQVNSPYNTYRVDGLPPGPICFPEVSSIDAVLNYEKHTYLYMCARADFSGYHEFATTLEQHNRNAAKWQRELNRRRIYR
jgi:UPF0755 protein